MDRMDDMDLPNSTAVTTPNLYKHALTVKPLSPPRNISYAKNGVRHLPCPIKAQIKWMFAWLTACETIRAESMVYVNTTAACRASLSVPMIPLLHMPRIGVTRGFLPMTSSFKQRLLNRALAAVMLLGSMTAHAADGDGVFTVADGASPWLDRVGQWSLTNVPENLKGSGPLPQGNCSSRSLDVPGKPASIVVGVQVNDAAKFTGKFPSAKDTGTQIAVKNPAGVTLPYLIFTLENPPEKIDGAGVFGAGLLLLKVEGGGLAPAASSTGT